MTAKENAERTIEALTGFVVKHADDKTAIEVTIAAAEAIAKLYKASASDMSDYTRMMQGMIETLKESERRKEPEGLGFMGIGI